MKLDFRTRLFLILSLFALLPAAVITGLWTLSVWRVLPSASAGAAWERVASSGQAAITSARTSPLRPDQAAALSQLERELQSSIVQARRLDFVLQRAIPTVIVLAVAALALLWIAASRVAGHLSRQLSRPIQELVGWTEVIQRGELPAAAAAARGAPEFATLRLRMRAMAEELALGRERAVEAERLVAFRETARRVAHELKNPLTPMQFALSQIRRGAPDSLAEPVRVLEEETARLDKMARSFAQFGRLPDGPASYIDVGELLKSTATACVPSHIALTLDVPPNAPGVIGNYDALQRAVMNVVLNAVEACGNSGAITISLASHEHMVRLTVSDTGVGIPAHRLPTIFNPYVTSKKEGTGLGLAIAQQAVLAMGGQIVASSRDGHGTEITIELPEAALATFDPHPPPLVAT